MRTKSPAVEQFYLNKEDDIIFLYNYNKVQFYRSCIM